MTEEAKLRIGVLALQGAFREHVSMLNKVRGVEAVEVRREEELAGLAGLVLPGGESTTMASIAERWNLVRLRWSGLAPDAGGELTRVRSAAQRSTPSAPGCGMESPYGGRARG